AIGLSVNDPIGSPLAHNKTIEPGKKRIAGRRDRLARGLFQILRMFRCLFHAIGCGGGGNEENWVSPCVAPEGVFLPPASSKNRRGRRDPSLPWQPSPVRPHQPDSPGIGYRERRQYFVQNYRRRPQYCLPPGRKSRSLRRQDWSPARMVPGGKFSERYAWP